jgi:hypothetical protein
MQTEMEIKLKKIKTASSILWQCSGLALALLPPIVIVFDAIVLAGGYTDFDFLDTTYPVAAASFRSRLALIIVSNLWLAVKLKRMYHLFKLFGNYSCGEVFTRGSARQIRQIGVTGLLLLPVSILCQFVPAGLMARPTHALGYGIDDALAGVVVIAISWIMELAAELQEETELTV